MAQAVHAAFQVAQAYPAETARWWDNSNFLVCLSVLDEDALLRWDGELVGTPHVLVREPDLGGEATALAVLPGTGAWRKFSSLPLAGKEVAAA